PLGERVVSTEWRPPPAHPATPPPRRISLPPYPFARDPFWLPGGKVLIAPPAPATAETSLLCPVWEPVIRPSHDVPRLARLRRRGNRVVDMARFRAVRPFPAVSDRIAIIGGDDAAVGAIRHHYPQARVVATRAGDDIDSIAHALQASLDGAVIDHLFWIAPQWENTALATQNLVSAQDYGVIHLFRTIKALLQLGYGTRTL